MFAQAKLELRAAMAEAHAKDGETIQAMSVVLGVTRQRAAQMLKEAE